MGRMPTTGERFFTPTHLRKTLKLFAFFLRSSADYSLRSVVGFACASIRASTAQQKHHHCQFDEAAIADTDA